MRVIVLACVALLAAGQEKPDVLASSEIAYSESGGLAGRVHEARVVARAGTVTIEYRPPDRGPAAMPLTATLDAARYLALWSEVERIDVWGVEAASKDTRGADMVACVLMVRLGTRTHTVRWNASMPLPAEIRAASELGARVVSVAREFTTER